MATAGVQPGDRIIKAQGKEILHFGNLIQAIYMVPAGESVTLTIVREEELFDVTVTLARNTDLGPLPEPPPE
jgi:S1-C subfamily serine protease